MESAQAMRENVIEAMRVILGEMASRSRTSLNEHFFENIWLDILEKRQALALNEILTLWAQLNKKTKIL